MQCSFILAGGIHQVKSMFQYQILSYCEHHRVLALKSFCLAPSGKRQLFILRFITVTMDPNCSEALLKVMCVYTRTRAFFQTGFFRLRFFFFFFFNCVDTSTVLNISVHMKTQNTKATGDDITLTV